MKIVLLCAGFFMLGIFVGSITMCLLNLSDMSRKVFYELLFMDDEMYKSLKEAVEIEKQRMKGEI